MWVLCLGSVTKAIIRRFVNLDLWASITGGVLGCLGLIWFVYQFDANWIFGGSKLAVFVAFGIMLTAGAFSARLIVACIGWQDAPMADLYVAYKNGRPASVVIGVAAANALFSVLANTLLVYVVYLVGF